MTAATAPPVTPSSDPSIAALQATAPPPATTDNKDAKNQSNTLANIAGAQLAAQVANWAAQLEFAKERFRLLELPQSQTQSQLAIDQLAFQKASTAWQQAFEEASLSGTYQGVPTVQWLSQQAQLTGTLDGQQTLQGKLTDAQVQQMNTAMQIAMKNQDLQERQFGFQQTQWNAEFGLQKAAQDMQYGGWTPSGAPTLQREQIENASAQQYLNLLASLRGPATAFAQARVIGNTPNSIRDIANAWLGKYQIGGTTGSGMNPTPITPSNMMGGVGPNGVQGTTTEGGYTFATANPIAAPSTLNFPAQHGPQSPYQDPAVTPYPQLTPYTFSPEPTAPGIPGSDGPIPGRGFDPSTWNAATQAAVAAWNAAHPGFVANGSQIGYTAVGAATPGTPGALPPPDAGNMPAVHYAEPAVPADPSQTISGGGSNESGASTGIVPSTGPVSGHSSDTMAATAATTQVPRYNYTGAPPMSYYTGATNAAGEAALYSPPGASAPAGMYNYTPTASGGYQVTMPGQPADPSQHQLSTSTPASPDDLSTWFSGVLPSQINAKNYGNMNTYNQTLGWAALEDQGWDIGAAQDAFKKSLPRYGGPSLGSFAALG